MTAQNFYARRQERIRNGVDERLVLELVHGYRLRMPRLGTRKLYYLLRPQMRRAGVKIGRDRLFGVLRDADLLVPPKPSERPKTTRFKPYLPTFRNRIKGLKVTGPNRVWIVDITYVRTKEDFLYLFLITDLFSRKIVGCELSESLEAEAALRVLRRALRGVKDPTKLIHHGDRGCQYACHQYVGELKKRGVTISMTEVNHCAENSHAERVNGILKDEFGLDEEFETKALALTETKYAIPIYNDERPHCSLGMRTPSEVHREGAR